MHHAGQHHDASRAQGGDGPVRLGARLGPVPQPEEPEQVAGLRGGGADGTFPLDGERRVAPGRSGRGQVGGGRGRDRRRRPAPSGAEQHSGYRPERGGPVQAGQGREEVPGGKVSGPLRQGQVGACGERAGRPILRRWGLLLVLVVLGAGTLQGQAPAPSPQPGADGWSAPKEPARPVTKGVAPGGRTVIATTSSPPRVVTPAAPQQVPQQTATKSTPPPTGPPMPASAPQQTPPAPTPTAPEKSGLVPIPPPPPMPAVVPPPG